MAKKKYRMRTVPEVQQEPVIDYVDPRTKSLQALDEEPNDKIIHSLVTNDLEKAKSRVIRKISKRPLKEEPNIYFSSGKEGFSRLLIALCQIVILGSFLWLIVSLSFLSPELKDIFLELLPIKDERFLVLFIPVAIIGGLVVFAMIASALTMVLLPILTSHKVESVLKWSKISLILSIVFGLIALSAVFILDNKLQSISWDYGQWDIVRKLSEVPFTAHKIIIGVALGISTLLAYPMLFFAAKKQHKENLEIQKHNLRKYQQ